MSVDSYSYGIIKICSKPKIEKCVGADGNVLRLQAAALVKRCSSSLLPKPWLPDQKHTQGNFVIFQKPMQSMPAYCKHSPWHLMVTNIFGSET